MLNTPSIASRVLQVFMPICYAFNRSNSHSCCDIVAQAIQAHPSMELCLSDSQYLFNVAGCGESLSGRGSLTDEGVTESSNFHFPTEPSQVKTLPSSGFAYEFAFSKNPDHNIRVPVPNARPQDRTASVTRKPEPTGDEYDEYEQEVPPIVTNTAGYQAMDFALNLFKVCINFLVLKNHHSSFHISIVESGSFSLQ